MISQPKFFNTKLFEKFKPTNHQISQIILQLVTKNHQIYATKIPPLFFSLQ